MSLKREGISYHQALAAAETIPRLIKAGYLRSALRHDADAITAAIARLREDLRSGHGTIRGYEVRLTFNWYAIGA
jgi:hypothetical protein